MIQDLNLRKKSYIRVNTREFNEALVIECLSHIYLANI